MTLKLANALSPDNLLDDRQQYARKGDWMQAFPSIQFWPLDPHPDEIMPASIGHALSMQCRYGGHCRRFLSVAEHCVHLASAVTKYKREALMHDAAETYLQDIVRPVKRYLANYVELEHRLAECIARKYDLIYPWPDEVVEADNRVLLDEQEQNMHRPPASWGLESLTPLGVRLEFWVPEVAEAMWMSTFRQLFA